MITLTRLKGQVIAINPDLIASIEENPDTTLHLFNGDTIVVRESIVEVIERVISYRKALVAAYSTDPLHSASRPPLQSR